MRKLFHLPPSKYAQVHGTRRVNVVYSIKLPKTILINNNHYLLSTDGVGPDFDRIKMSTELR